MRRFGLGLGLLLLSLLGAQMGAHAQTATPEPTAGQARATFAGGCFWCVESDFDKVPGVLSTTSGYIGGNKETATYNQVSSGATEHIEAVEVVYDPSKVTYQKLLDYFWRHVDPLTKDAQFCDHGRQYRTAIFTHGEEQKSLADASKKQIEGLLEGKVYTEIKAAGPFYVAEEYHQDYYVKNPAKYKFYRWNCGRDQRVEQVWGGKK
jgi:peptide-methionine (S)-S-oxide reductase